MLCTLPVVHAPPSSFMILVPKCMDKTFLCVRRLIGLHLVLYLPSLFLRTYDHCIVVPTKRRLVTDTCGTCRLRKSPSLRSIPLVVTKHLKPETFDAKWTDG